MTGQYIFFPFSHISQDQMDTLQIFLPSFSFFPAATDLKHHPWLQELVDGGRAVPVFSSKDDLSSVDYTFEQYMAWVKLHKGNEHNLRFLIKDSPYFTSDSDLSAIKAQIRGTKKRIEPQRSEKDVLHRDLLFLKMAKQCDEEKESIDLQLRNIDRTKNRMLSTLLGEGEPMDALVAGEKKGIHDPGAVMTRERIEAWSRLMVYHNAFQKAGEIPIFVTTSEAVVDYLETICSDVINALDIDPIKVHENDCENKPEWQRQVSELLRGVAKGDDRRQNHLTEVKDGCSLSGQIKLSLFSGNNTHNLFNLRDRQIAVCLIRIK